VSTRDQPGTPVQANEHGSTRGHEWAGRLRHVWSRIAASQRHSPLSAGGWSIASFVVSQTIGSLLYLPLARLLNADDFGLVTEARLISAGLTLLVEASLVRALIRLPDGRDELAQATLWLSVIAGSVAAVLCALAGIPAAAIFHEERLRLVLALLALGVLVSALGAVPHALLARELDFRRKTLPETVSIGLGGVAALGAALLGAGVYSLVAYAVVGAALSSAVAWRVVRWRPRRELPHGPTMRRILTFGLPASGGDLALYTRLNADYALTGRRLGADLLGVYTLAWTAAAAPAAVITSFFGNVSYATFSRLQRDRTRMRAVYLSITRLIAAVALPLFISAVFLRHELITVLYGERWLPMLAPLLPLFLLQGVREICRPGAALTLATGHNRVYMVCGLTMLPLTIAAVLIGTRSGITGVAWAMLIAVGGASLIWPAIALVVLRPRAAELWRTAGMPLLLAAVTIPTVALTRAALDAAGLPAAVRLVAAIVAGFAVFLGAGRLCLPSLRADFARLRETLPDDEPERAPSGPPRAESVTVSMGDLPLVTSNRPHPAASDD
jgi:O-antigen/teichoic acid export membrane protein